MVRYFSDVAQLLIKNLWHTVSSVSTAQFAAQDQIWLAKKAFFFESHMLVEGVKKQTFQYSLLEC